MSGEAASATLEGTILPATGIVSTLFLVSAESRRRVGGASDQVGEGKVVSEEAKQGQVEEQR